MADDKSLKCCYMAIAKLHGGKYTVGEFYLQTGFEVHPIGDCRDFDAFEEADQVAKDMAAGKYPDIRPAGIYVSNR